MTGKTHQIIGLCVGIGTYLLFAPHIYGPASFAAAVVVSSLGSLLPDIDSPNGKIWGYLPFGRTASELVNPFLQHRNLTHSFLGVFLVALGVRAIGHHIPTYWGLDIRHIQIAGLAAYLSHLVADMVTVEGIPLLFPIPRMYGLPPHPFAALRIETGHWFENLIIFPLVNIALIALVILHWPTIQRFLFQ